MQLPVLSSPEDAIQYYRDEDPSNKALIALVVGTLSEARFSNRAIREALGLPKVYEVTHYRRVHKALTQEQLMLWYENPTRISFGHARALAGIPDPKRESLIRQLLFKKISVRELEQIAKGETEEGDADVKRYAAAMEEQLGRPISLRYDASKKAGSITLSFYGLNDLDEIAGKLGFVFEG